MKALLSAALFVLSSPALLLSQKEFLKPQGLAPANGYTHVVTARPGRLVFVAGQVANGPKGDLVGKGDLRAQTMQVFENLKTALASAGASFDDVVKITWYVKGYKPADLPTLREVRNLYVNEENPPASTLVGVEALFRDEYLIEVEAIAVVADEPQKK